MQVKCLVPECLDVDLQTLSFQVIAASLKIKDNPKSPLLSELIDASKESNCTSIENRFKTSTDIYKLVNDYIRPNTSVESNVATFLKIYSQFSRFDKTRGEFDSHYF